jgi:uncharacterized protein YjbI with pentapeptide repeats
MLVQYVLPSGAAAGLATYFVGWLLSFTEYLTALPPLLRIGFFVCLFGGIFVVSNHALHAVRRLLSGSARGDQSSAQQVIRIEADTYIENLHVGAQEQDVADEIAPVRASREGELGEYLERLRPTLEDVSGSPRGSLNPVAAQSYTLNLLDRASPRQKRRVVQLLRDCGLIGHEARPVVSLNDADLSTAELGRMNLQDTNFDGANLRSADLSGAVFSHMQGNGVDFMRAVEEGLPDYVYFKPVCISSLCADLSGTVLREAKLMGCWLSANLEVADLQNADLRASASRQATFRTWRRSVRSNRCSKTDCYIRYSPIGGAS